MEIVINTLWFCSHVKYVVHFRRRFQATRRKFGAVNSAGIGRGKREHCLRTITGTCYSVFLCLIDTNITLEFKVLAINIKLFLQLEVEEKNPKEVPESDDDCVIVDVEPPEPVSPPKTVRSLYIRYYGAFTLSAIEADTETDKLTHTHLYATHFLSVWNTPLYKSI